MQSDFWQSSCKSLELISLRNANLDLLLAKDENRIPDIALNLIVIN